MTPLSTLLVAYEPHHPYTLSSPLNFSFSSEIKARCRRIGIKSLRGSIEKEKESNYLAN